MAATTFGTSGLQVSSKSSCLVRQWLDEDQNKRNRTSSSFFINFQERPERLGLGAELSAADSQRYSEHPLCQSYSGALRPSPLNGGALAFSLKDNKSANLKSQSAQLQDTSCSKDHIVSSNELEVSGSKHHRNSSRLFVVSDSDEDVSRECLGASTTERVNCRSKLKAKHVNLRKENKSTVQKQQQQLLQNHHHRQQQVQQNHHQQQQVQQNHHHQQQQQVQQNQQQQQRQQVQQNQQQQQQQRKTLPQQCSNVSGRRCKQDLPEDLRTMSVAETCIPQVVLSTQEVDIDRSSHNQEYINPPSGNQVDISPFSSEFFHKRRKRTRQYLCIPVNGQMVLMCLYGPAVAAGTHGVRRRKTAFQLKQTILMHSRREFVPYFVTKKFR